MKYLSLCLPTNGIGEWVFPVLDILYKQESDHNEWELIVTDNGNNEEFFEKMTVYASKQDNLIYKRTKAFLFENQIESLRLASGEYLKFMNHRSVFEPDSLQWMINLVKEHISSKPIMYLSNGALGYRSLQTYNNFDSFVKGLREYGSWTTGVGVWKSDFDSIPNDYIYNKISPHSDVLYWVRNNRKYIIDDSIWSHDIDNSHINKGKYDLYRAFAVEEITIVLNLFNDRNISADTFKYIVKCYEKCVARFYMNFNILHKPCSYNLDGFDESMGIFLSKNKVILRAYAELLRFALYKIYRYSKKILK